MYKCMNGLSPGYLADMFYKRSQVHRYNTRNNESLHLPKCQTALGQQSFTYRGATIWNSLPPEVRSSTSLRNFKCKLKRNLLSSWLNN